jgi:hypothetical protein
MTVDSRLKISIGVIGKRRMGSQTIVNVIQRSMWIIRVVYHHWTSQTITILDSWIASVSGPHILHAVARKSYLDVNGTLVQD